MDRLGTNATITRHITTTHENVRQLLTMLKGLRINAIHKSTINTYNTISKRTNTTT